MYKIILTTFALMFSLSCAHTWEYVKGKGTGLLVHRGSHRSFTKPYKLTKCNILSGDKIVKTILCKNAKEYAFSTDDNCGGVKDWEISFPDRSRKMLACRQFDYPERSKKEKIVFAVLGDSGAGNTHQMNVGKTLHKICLEKKCDFALVNGDNIYDNGVKTVWSHQFDTKFEVAYKDFGKFPFYIVSGNHDYRANIMAEIEYSYFSERWVMLDYFYSIPDLPDWLHIMGLDSTAIVDAQRASRNAQDEFLKQMCGKEGWKFLFAHHPNLSNGSHGNQSLMSEVTLPNIKKCGINGFFAGHDHNQEHIVAKGLYHMVVQGAASKLRDVKVVNRDVRYGSGPHTGLTVRQKFIAREYGFGIVEMTEKTFKMSFYNEAGDVIYSFEDVK